EVRDGGKHALLILDTVAPLLDAWELAMELAEAAGDLGDAEALAAQRRAALAALLERAASLQSGGALTMLALLETEAMAALGIPGQRQAPNAEANELTFSLADFRGRRQSELERLQRLQDRGVQLTESSLSALGITRPGDVAKGVKSAREMQSLSDGQAVLDKSMAAAGLFPAMVPGASFSRFGLGSDVGASKAVAAHLRTLLALEQAHFRPTTAEVDSHQSRQLQASLQHLASVRAVVREMWMSCLSQRVSGHSWAGRSCRESRVGLAQSHAPERKVVPCSRWWAKQALLAALLLEVYERHSFLLMLLLLAAAAAALLRSCGADARRLAWHLLRARQPNAKLYRQAGAFCSGCGAIEVREVLEDEDLCEELARHLNLRPLELKRFASVAAEVRADPAIELVDAEEVPEAESVGNPADEVPGAQHHSFRTSGWNSKRSIKSARGGRGRGGLGHYFDSVTSDDQAVRGGRGGSGHYFDCVASDDRDVGGGNHPPQRSHAANPYFSSQVGESSPGEDRSIDYAQTDNCSSDPKPKPSRPLQNSVSKHKTDEGDAGVGFFSKQLWVCWFREFQALGSCVVWAEEEERNKDLPQ
ncbi:atpA, partial [Symbiodinium necroappetens]